MLNSDFRELCSVILPWANRQKYMHTFDLWAPVMPPGFEDYLPLVVALCAAAGAARGTAHMTVDEKVVLAGASQRRPGPHVDGCFVAGGWEHNPNPWLHYCNNTGSQIGRMAVIVAASVAGCRAWRGHFDGAPKGDGDLRHIEPILSGGAVLRANTGYLLSPDCVHESMVFTEDTRRTFLRIALPLHFNF